MKKKLLSIVLTLCMVVTLFPLLGGKAFAEEASFTYTGPDGNTVTITQDDVEAVAGAEQTFTPIKQDGTPNQGKAVTAKFASLAALVDAKSGKQPNCIYSLPTSDYTFEYRPDSDVCVYFENGSFNTAVDGGYGFLWATGFTSVTGADHAFGEANTCTNTIDYFNPDKPGKDKKPCGLARFVYTAPDGQEYSITEEDIDTLAGAEQTFTPIKQDGTPNQGKAVTAKFASLSALVDAKSGKQPNCIYSLPTSNYTFEYRPDSGVCVYFANGAFNTAVDGGYGFLWATGFTSAAGKDHVYHDTEDVCTNTVDFYNPDKGGKDKQACGAKDPAKRITPAVTLEADSYAWDGQEKKPAVTVKDGDTVLAEETDYEVAYADGRKEVGTYDVTVTCKGAYKGSATVSFKIVPASVAKAAVTGIKDKVYTGKAVKQSPVVKLNGKTLKASTDYTVSYKANKNVGKATVTIEAKGHYTGKITKSFKINPKGTSLVKVVAGKKKFTAKWKKQGAKMSKSTITGYELQYSLKKNFKSAKKVKVKGVKKISKAVKKLKAKKTYYVRVRTYKKVGKVTFYSPWSKNKKVKIKK